MPPDAWAPHDDWMPDPAWPTPPRGWEFWTVVEHEATAPATGVHAYGTDRGSWLASLRARGAAAKATVAAPAGPEREAAGGEWELDGLLTSAGRAEA
ncbi:hypothetical protein [Terrabacter sp. NPDC080008]|uniref:hypothetical protein n=1 Tax=Terrabacter sp. NPDC080008 TaxID=3155176 RepID=UPI00344E8BAA